MNALATVEAVNVDAAIKKAALEFDVQDIKKLIAAATVYIGTAKLARLRGLNGIP